MREMRHIIRRWLFCGIVAAGLLPAARAQTASIRGTVADRLDGKPMAGVIVALRNGEGKIVRNALTSAQGTFLISVPERGGEYVLYVSCLGYAPQSVPLAVEAGDLRISLEPAPTTLREVTVKASPIGVKGDTLVYNVERFSDVQDKTIGDVIKKLPGIEVSESGQIKYQGEPINKFYIEGTDLLEGKYGLATNNISKKDVKSVEILQNHQPIKALEGIAPSDNAALNLRLQEDAKARWVGTVGIGAGASPGMLDGALFAMRIAAGWQSMQNLKVNNTGRNPAAENRNFSIADILNRSENQRSLQEHIRLDGSSAPLDEKRVRFNRSALFNTANVRKIGSDYQLNLHLSYAGDRLTGERSSETIHFLEGGDRVVVERQHNLARQHDLSGRITLQGNTSGFYLKNNLAAGWLWNDRESVLDGTYPNKQRAELPSGNFANDFQLLKRAGRRTFTVTSYNQFLTKPHYLTVERQERKLQQEVRSGSFYSHSNISLGWGWKRWQFDARGGIGFNAGSLRSHLEGLDEPALSGFPTANRSRLNTFRSYLHYSATYEKSRLRLNVSLPLDYYRYAFRDRLDRANDRSADDWRVVPQVSLRYNLSARWTLFGSAQTGNLPVNDAIFFNGLILNNYQNLSTGLIDFSNGSARSVSARFEYKDPIRSLFFNGSASRSWNTVFPLSGQWFVGEYILQRYEPISADNRRWNLHGSASKGIDGVKGLIALDADYSRTDGRSGQNGALTDYTSTFITVSPRFKGRLTPWCNAEYRFSLRRNGMNIPERGEKHHTNGFDQNMSLYIIPSKKFYFTLSGEHYRNEWADGTVKNLFLADLHATWRLREQWEVYFALTNLFDRREYAYTLLGTMSVGSYAYRIRPRQFLVSTFFRF